MYSCLRSLLESGLAFRIKYSYEESFVLALDKNTIGEPYDKLDDRIVVFFFCF